MAAETLVNKAFTATGQSASFFPTGTSEIRISGGVGTVQLEMNDSDAGWIAVSRDAAGTAASYAVSTSAVVFTLEEPTPGAEYRFNCTAYTSGTVRAKCVRNSAQ